MFIGNAHISITRGDFIFAQWEEDGYKKFRRKIHELRCAGYRKVDQEHDFLNYYEYYKKKGRKKVITVTFMFP